MPHKRYTNLKEYAVFKQPESFLTSLAQYQQTACSGVDAISLDHLAAGYGAYLAFYGLSGTFPAGSLTAIVGPNGGGKSTLLKTIGGILKPKQGTLSMGSLTQRNMAYLAQKSAFDTQFPISVQDVVALGAWQAMGPWRAIDAPEMARAAEALALVGMAGKEDYRLDMLSGGQLQRVLFARLILQNAPVILLDEPFAGIDPHTREDLMEIVRVWHSQGRTVIAVLHDLDLVYTHFPTTLLLARKSLGWGAPADVLTPKNMTQAFTCALEDVGACAPGHIHGHTHAGVTPGTPASDASKHTHT